MRGLGVIGILAITGCSQILGIDGQYGDQTTSDDGGAAPSNAQPGNSGGSGDAGGTTGNDAGTSAPGQAGDDDGSVIAPPPGDGAVPPPPPPTDGAPAVVSPLARILTGTTIVSAGATTQRVTLDNVDPNRAFVLSGTTFAVNSPTDTEVSGRINGATELVFARTGTNGNIPVRYYVAEFQSGVQVIRGNTSMGNNTRTVTLPAAVDLAHSFPLVTYRNTGSNCGNDDFVRAELTSPTQLTLSIGLSSSDGIAEWQIVSFAGATVQSGTIAMGANTTSTTAALPAPVNPAQTWLVLTHEAADATGTAAELLVSGRIDNASQLAFNRAGGGASIKATWYAISFTNGTTVQNGTLSLGDNASNASAPLAAYDATKSIAASGGTWQRVGTTAFTNAPNTGFGTFTLNATGTTLDVARGVSGGTSKANLDYAVVTFF